MGDNAGNLPHASANQAKVIAEQERCYDLRMEGKSIREIARITGLSRSTVQNRLNDEWIKRIAPRSDALRIQQLEQLDEIHSRLQQELDVIDVGDKPETVVKLAGGQVNVIDKAAKLMGTYAPQKVAISDGKETEVPASLRQALALAEERSAKREAEIRARNGSS